MGSIPGLGTSTCCEYGQKKCSKDFFFFLFGHPAAHGVPRPGIRSKPPLRPKLQLRHRRMWHRPSRCWAGDRACVLALQRGCRSCFATVRTPQDISDYIIYLPIYIIFLLIFLVSPEARGSSWARAGTCTTAATRVTAVTMLDP